MWNPTPYENTWLSNRSQTKMSRKSAGRINRASMKYDVPGEGERVLVNGKISLVDTLVPVMEASVGSSLVVCSWAISYPVLQRLVQITDAHNIKREFGYFDRSIQSRSAAYYSDVVRSFDNIRLIRTHEKWVIIGNFILYGSANLSESRGHESVFIENNDDFASDIRLYLSTIEEEKLKRYR